MDRLTKDIRLLFKSNLLKSNVDFTKSHLAIFTRALTFQLTNLRKKWLSGENFFRDIMFILDDKWKKNLIIIVINKILNK